MTREKIGTVTNYDGDKKEVEIQLTGELKEGDKVALLGPVAYEMEEVKSLKESSQDKVIIKTNKQVRENTAVYKIS